MATSPFQPTALCIGQSYTAKPGRIPAFAAKFSLRVSRGIDSWHHSRVECRGLPCQPRHDCRSGKQQSAPQPTTRDDSIARVLVDGLAVDSQVASELIGIHAIMLKAAKRVRTCELAISS